jgi:hypothetical protein
MATGKDKTRCRAIGEDLLKDGTDDIVFQRYSPLVSPTNRYEKRNQQQYFSERTFSMNEKIYLMVLWKVSSSTAWSPIER